MRILFTRTESLLSKVIRGVTKEPVSHCALEMYGWVLHSNLLGVHAERLGSFSKSSDIIFSVEIPDNPREVFSALAQYQGRSYDFLALLYLGLRYLCPFLPKKNLWQVSGMFICTEFITKSMYGSEDSLITPYQLYLKVCMTKPQLGENQ